MKNSMNLIERHFLATLLIFSLIGLFFSKYIYWTSSMVHPMLSLIAFCVGLTLKPQNYKNVFYNKKLIFSTLAFKYAIAPLFTFLICSLAKLPTEYIVGLVTLTCCPAANTGNIMCYLARGNTAMIITTTITGALLSPLVTPIIIFILLHKIVHIQFSVVMLTIVSGIAIPMLVGMALAYFFPKKIDKLKPVIPSIGILSVSIIIAAILSQHANTILTLNIGLPIICASLITLFLSLGFLFSRLINSSWENSVAMSFEVGTFDGVLGILLTIQIIGMTGTLPVVLFAVLNLIIGSIASKMFSSTNPMRISA